MGSEREVVIRITVQPALERFAGLEGQGFIASAVTGLAYGAGDTAESAVIECLENIAERWRTNVEDEEQLGKPLLDELAEMRELLDDH